LEGSAPFFWNWSEAYQREICNGQRHFLTGPLLVFTKPQKRHWDAALHKLMQKKVVQVRKQGYVSAGTVVSGTHYFLVPKGLCLEVISSAQNFNSWFACANLFYIFEQKLTII
jgi:hypothetical protein